ncbi:unnamed protein product [Discula destructiva]
MATSILEASIEGLQQDLSSGTTSSVELTAKHLIRIAHYDRRGTLLNSVPVINTSVFDVAQASDEIRATGKTIRSPLDGIPVTIKDSYKIKGMTLASGSPAFQNLIVTEDAFVVSQIKNAGGVILGRTNMPPMAAGGMQRGVYGRAESPYNADYLTAAHASGSSNGSGTATAASFGVIGMGEETYSSGRSPASNNGLVAYTPSRGIISSRGNWPLFSTRDTVVPHTRSVRDMMTLLDVLVATDDIKTGDFWREQPFVRLTPVEEVRPKSYHDLADAKSLAGKRLGVPKMYIGEEDPEALPVYTSPAIRKLWDKARATLESLGAAVVEVDFPIVTNDDKPRPGDEKSSDSPYPPPIFRDELDMAQFSAYTWDDFLRQNNDTAGSGITTLGAVDGASIFPYPPGCLRDRYPPSEPLIKSADFSALAQARTISTFDMPNLGAALQSYEATRKRDLEDWMDRHGLDAVVFPANGDVGRADTDRNEASARDAWRNGVLYSNGNCALRKYGVPTVSVPMGAMEGIGMPVNLTFATKAYRDSDLFGFAYAFEQMHKGRTVPGRTPALPTDAIPVKEATAGNGVAAVSEKGGGGGGAPELTASAKRAADKKEVELSGSVRSGHIGGLKSLEVFVDGVLAATPSTADGEWTATVELKTEWNGRPEEKNVPDPNLAMIVVLAVANNGRAAGELLFA